MSGARGTRGGKTNSYGVLVVKTECKDLGVSAGVVGDGTNDRDTTFQEGSRDLRFCTARCYHYLFTRMK
jgi:hypothetical protein